MGCNCNDKNVIIPPSTSCDSPQESGAYQSMAGKFYDKLIEDFTIPQVGNIGTIRVAQANLWAVGQWICLLASKTKYCYLRITATGENSIKVLNGCIKGDNSSTITGNPDPGFVIKEGSVMFPTNSPGCVEETGSDIAVLIEKYGSDAVKACIESQTELCFPNLIDVQEDEEAHMFGGAVPSCECAPEGLLTSCLRKIRKIFTGSNGKTLCFGEIPSTTDDDETVNDVIKNKHIVYLDGRGCLKKGRTAKTTFDPREGGLKFFPKQAVVYNGTDSILTVYHDANGIPEQFNGQQIWVELDFHARLGGAGGNVYSVRLDGFELIALYTGADGGGQTNERFSWFTPATAGGSFTLQGISTISIGTPTKAMDVFIKGYWA